MQKEKDGPYHHYTPKSVYFKTQEESITSKFRDLFNFVDFGMTGNAFLLQCGVRSEPTTAELCVIGTARPMIHVTRLT